GVVRREENVRATERDSNIRSSRLPPDCPRQPQPAQANRQPVYDPDSSRQERQPQRQPSGEGYAGPAGQHIPLPPPTREFDGSNGERDQAHNHHERHWSPIDHLSAGATPVTPSR